MIEHTGCIINVISFTHSHVRSLYEEGLWGFPNNRVNKSRWDALQRGCDVMFYGSMKYGDVERKGIYLRAVLKEKRISEKPVNYWVQNPTGYPLQIRVEFLPPSDPNITKPILKEELSGAFGIPIFRQKTERWSLIVFGEEKTKGITYSYEKFAKVSTELIVRNQQVEIPSAPDHEKIKEIVYQMGLLQQRTSLKEVQLDSYKIDVCWKRLPKSDPYIVFEVQVGGNLNDALTKLKHARDIWNSVPVLITTPEQIQKAQDIASGAFHEIKDELKIVEWKRIVEAYELKGKYKKLESDLGIS